MAIGAFTRDFRSTLGNFPTGVTVITGMADDGPTGMSVSSFCSLSLKPAQVLFCPARGSTTWSRIEASGAFCANVLSASQSGLSSHFAGSADDRFAGVPWRPGVTGAPILSGSLAWIECTIADVIDGGDHSIVIGQVAELSHDPGGSPLVYFRGGYHDIDKGSVAMARRA